MQYVGLCVFSLPIYLVMIERIYILGLVIINKSEVWAVTHYLGLGHETMVSAVCLSIFLCNVFFRRDCRSGAPCLGRVTVRPLRDRALVNFNHMCPIFGWAAGPLTRGAGVMASLCPTVIDIALSCSFFENNSQPLQNKPAHLLLTQHIGRAQLSS